MAQARFHDLAFGAVAERGLETRFEQGHREIALCEHVGDLNGIAERVEPDPPHEARDFLIVERQELRGFEAHDHADGHALLGRGGRGAGELFAEQVRGAKADFATGIVDAAERGRGAVAIDGIVAETEQRQIVGHAPSARRAGVTHGHGERIVRRENAARFRQLPQEFGEFALDDFPRGRFPQRVRREKKSARGDAAFRQRFGETFPAFPRVAARAGNPRRHVVLRCGATHVGEVAQAETGEVLGRAAARLAVVGNDARKTVAAAFAADVHHGHPGATPRGGLGWPGSGHSLDSYQNWDGRGTVLQTDYNAVSIVDTILIPFTPSSAAFGVLISSLDFDVYTGGQPARIDWSIVNGGTTIVNGVWTRTSGGRDTIATGMTLAQAQANAGATISLRLDRVSGLGSYLAVDNLVFDQVNAQVPEPTAAALGALGLGAMAMRRRRQVS